MRISSLGKSSFLVFMSNFACACLSCRRFTLYLLLLAVLFWAEILRFRRIYFALCGHLESHRLYDYCCNWRISVEWALNTSWFFPGSVIFRENWFSHFHTSFHQKLIVGVNILFFLNMLYCPSKLQCGEHPNLKKVNWSYSKVVKWFWLQIPNFATLDGKKIHHVHKHCIAYRMKLGRFERGNGSLI